MSRRVGDAFVGLNATVSRGTESHFRLGIFLSIHRFLNYIDTWAHAILSRRFFPLNFHWA